MKKSIIFLLILSLISINSFQVYAIESSSNITNAANEEIVAVLDIDLGDYQSEMQVGDNQLLSITLLPINATNQDATYSTSNEKVASINALGRITGQGVGQAIISVKSDKIEKKFTITIKEKVEEKTVMVTDIEVGEFEEEMEVGKTQTISGTILPSDAINQTIEYTSSNPSVATISGSGKITAVSKGNTKIILKADKVVKELPLTVKIATKKIDVNETYLVLKVGSEFKIQAQALPKEANQTLTYRSTNDGVISVNSSGVIKALKVGRSSVIISNKDSQRVITVVVNKDGVRTGEEDKEAQNEEVLGVSSNRILDILMNSSEDTTYYEPIGEEVISKEVLKYLYESKKTLVILSDEYSITIKGKDILNYENEVSTSIIFKDDREGTEFVINNNNQLPGTIELQLSDNIIGKGKHIYLYHTQKEKYELLSTKINEGTLLIDVAGRYVIANEIISSLKVNLVDIIIGIVALLGLIVAYIVVKKKYWFW